MPSLVYRTRHVMAWGEGYRWATRIIQPELDRFLYHRSIAIERTEGIRSEVDAAIQQSVGRCIQETDLGMGERTVVRITVTCSAWALVPLHCIPRKEPYSHNPCHPAHTTHVILAQSCKFCSLLYTTALFPINPIGKAESPRAIIQQMAETEERWPGGSCSRQIMREVTGRLTLCRARCGTRMLLGTSW